jgi:hypothetical protein
MKRTKTNKKNLFFPVSIEEEELIEEVEEEFDPLEGEGLYANDWYDLPGGQYFIIFPTNDGYAEEAN